MRIIIESRGSYSVVNGKRHAMESGDIVLTPPLSLRRGKIQREEFSLGAGPVDEGGPLALRAGEVTTFSAVPIN